MEILTTTPFGRRPMTAALIENAQRAQENASIGEINKWELFRELCAAKTCFCISDRDLTVLNALLSFHREPILSDNDMLIVFPSNKTLAERAHGMAESTLRRHLAVLVDVGLIVRHDSPNGKRYAARERDGTIAMAFGFDLRPLLVRGKEIVLAATEARDAARRLKRLRDEITVIKRDAVKLLEYGLVAQPQFDWEPLQIRLLEAHKASRRSLCFDDRVELRNVLVAILQKIRLQVSSDSMELSGKDCHSERHFQNSDKDSNESEPTNEQTKPGDQETETEPQTLKPKLKDGSTPVPLALVLKAVPDILPYAPSEIRNWHQFISTAHTVRGFMGVSHDAWHEAIGAMGPENAATALACILQRISKITNPGGYLRALTRKAESGLFSTGPMVMALLNGGAKTASPV